jgi:rRNA biogenesis protein RRP5
VCVWLVTGVLQARHDVWTALLNLELAYGSAASVKEVFERAVRQNDAESMHMKMATLYAAAAHADDATRVLDAATRKFGGTSMRVWTALGEHTLRRGDTATFRKTLQVRCAQCEARVTRAVSARRACCRAPRRSTS